MPLAYQGGCPLFCCFPSPSFPKCSLQYTQHKHNYTLWALNVSHSSPISHPSVDRIHSWYLTGPSAFFFLSLDSQPACRDPNITLSRLNLELNELLNQTQEIPLIFTGHNVSHGRPATLAGTWKWEQTWCKAVVEYYKKQGRSLWKSQLLLFLSELLLSPTRKHAHTHTHMHSHSHAIWLRLSSKVVRIMCSGSGGTNPGSVCALLSLLSCTAPHGAHREISPLAVINQKWWWLLDNVRQIKSIYPILADFSGRTQLAKFNPPLGFYDKQHDGSLAKCSVFGFDCQKEKFIPIKCLVCDMWGEGFVRFSHWIS